jgi:hypothetical protein
MEKAKKGDLSLNIIIITVILLVVLVVVLMVFTGRMDIFGKGIQQSSSNADLSCAGNNGQCGTGFTCSQGQVAIRFNKTIDSNCAICCKQV